MKHGPPPLWTADQFETARLASIELFREDRMLEPLEEYSGHFERARQAVETLLELSVDLTVAEQTDVALQICTTPNLLWALRYLAGPPISEDDLKTVAVLTLAAGPMVKDPSRAVTIVRTVMLGLDRNRFVWIGEDREPTEREREAAVMGTAVPMAYRKVLTARQNESSDAQELATAQALIADAGFKQVEPKPIHTFKDAPPAGHFCRETMFGSDKADLVVSLWDGRYMPIECKVSNSSTNSIKRLNKDAAVKATRWISDFGSNMTLPAAVLAGVFKRKNLEDAQNRGLSIFWAHELDQLVAFINSTK